jgi:hypothetical protein
MSARASVVDTPLDLMSQRLTQADGCITALCVTLTQRVNGDESGASDAVLNNLAWSAQTLLRQAAEACEQFALAPSDSELRRVLQ